MPISSVASAGTERTGSYPAGADISVALPAGGVGLMSEQCGCPADKR